MKNPPYDCKKSEAQARELVGETLMQLDAAKKMVEKLRSDGCKATEAYEESRARVKLLEELVSKLKSEAEELKTALAKAETRRNEEQVQREEQTKQALQREAELEAELRRCSYEIEELRSNMMDKDTELHCILEENDSLVTQLENALSGYTKREMEKEIHGLNAEVEKLQALVRSNETMKVDMNEALSELDCLREEVEKSRRRAGRVAEQLEAAQAANAEMEGELRRLKVQTDQWRKAAEVAAALLNKGQAVERNGSVDEVDDDDDDLIKKKNVKMLTRFGVLWKK